MPHIQIEFFPGGNVTIAPHGYAGEACTQATRPYMQALRASSVQTVSTAEAQLTEAPVTQAQTEKATT